MSAPLRLAVVGMGAWGWRYVSSAAEAGNAIVTHAAGNAEGRMLGKDPELQPRRLHQIVSSREWRKLLDAPVDAFVVATPPETHEEIACAMLEAGRPVVLEKPMALDFYAVLRIALAAKKHHTPLLVMHQHLFAPAYEELLSRVVGWDAIASSSRGGGLGPNRSYSALWDYGPHDVALHLGLARAGDDSAGGDDADEPGHFRVVAASRRGGSFGFALEGEKVTAIAQVWNDRAPKARGLVAIGYEGMYVYDDLDPEGHKLRFRGQPLAIPDEKPLARAIRAFADVVRAGGTNDWRFAPSFGVEVTRLLSVVDARTTK